MGQQAPSPNCLHPLPQLLRVEDVPVCPVCAAPGNHLYRGLRDQLFQAPGEWSISRCTQPACGALWLSPRPIESDLPEAYKQYYTHAEDSAIPARSVLARAYAAVRNGYLQVWGGYRIGCGPRTLSLLAPLALLEPRGTAQLQFNACFCPAPAAGARFLEVGCGSGAALARMRELGWSVQGIDFDPGAIAAARRRGLDATVGSLPEMRFAASSFDAVFMCHVIEHVLDPIALLRECKRVLKPGGRLVMVTPNASSWGHRRFGRAWRGLEPPRHLQIFTPASILLAMESVGFSSCSARVLSRTGAYIFGMSRLIHDRGDDVALGTLAIRSFSARGLLDTYAERAKQLVDKQAGSELLALAVR